MFYRKLGAKVRGNKRQRTVTVRRVRLELEELGQRIVPTTDTWIGPAGGLWSDPANWSLGRTPQSTDFLYTGSTASTDDIPSVMVITWENTGSTITINQNCSVNGQQYIMNDSGGTIWLNPGSIITSDNYIYEYGTVNAQGNNMIPSSAQMNAPNIMLEPGGTLNVLYGTSSVPALSVTGDINDYGTVNIGQPSSMGPSAGVMSVSGAFYVEAQGTLTLYPGSILNDVSGTTLYVNGTATMMGATIIGDVEIRGTFDSQGATPTDGGYGDEIEGDVRLKSGTLSIDTNFHVLTVTGNVTMEAATFSVTVFGTNGDQLNVGGSVTLSANNSSTTLDVTGGGYPPFPRSWAIIKAGGGVSGDFGIKNFPPPPSGFHWYGVNAGSEYDVGYN